MAKQTKYFNPQDILTGIQFDQIKKHPNILIAAAFWEKDRYDAAKVCYSFMRKIDDMIDDRKADIAALDDCEKTLFTGKVSDWIECLQGKAADDASLEEVIEVISKYNIPLSLFNSFAKSMIYDIHHDGFPTFESFLNYAEGAAVAPASVFLHLCCLNGDYENYSDSSMDLVSLARPCAIFSYIVHIIRDFEIDQKNNLNYFADDLLQANNLTPIDLKEMANSGIVKPGFRDLIKTYMDKAGRYKLETETAIQALAPFLNPRYLLSLKIIFSLYLEIYNRIDLENDDYRTSQLTPSMQETKQIVADVIKDYQVE
jgi:phytoene/squalene synthetase